jgi:hypothetical protein
MLVLLRMPVWEPHPRMFRTGQSHTPAGTVHEPFAPPTNKQAGVTNREAHEHYASLVEELETNKAIG